MKPCEQYLGDINELIEGTLHPIRRAALEDHLEGCESCRGLVADLRAIAAAAGSVPPLQPPDRTWMQIAGRLRQEGRVSAGLGGALPRRNYTVVALAAALVIAVGASLVVLIPRDRPATTAATQSPADQHAATESNAAQADAVQTADSELTLAGEHLQNALDQAAKRGDLDPDTASVLQKNYVLITQAIDESRAALKSNPESVPARESLYEGLRQKIQFLQDTIALMNHMRKGDAAGAAEIVESGKS